jgi:hypothetical protein
LGEKCTPLITRDADAAPRVYPPLAGKPAIFPGGQALAPLIFADLQNPSFTASREVKLFLHERAPLRVLSEEVIYQK